MLRHANRLSAGTLLVCGTLFFTSAPFSARAGRNPVANTSHPMSTTSPVAVDRDAKQKTKGRVVKINARTLVLESKGLKLEFHVLPQAKITRNLLKVDLKAILPGDTAEITHVNAKGTEKNVAVEVKASAKQ